MKDNTPSDSALLSRAAAGDHEALGELFDRHHRRIYSRALSLVGGVHDAQDATAIVFFELWRQRDRVRVVDESTLPWLMVVTRNVCRNVQRSSRRHRALLQRLPRISAMQSVASESLRSGDLLDALDPVLASALRELPPKTYSLLVLTAIDGLPIADAAHAVGLSPSAAKSRLSRARSHVRQLSTNGQPALSPKDA